MDSKFIAQQFHSIEYLFTKLQKDGYQPRLDLYHHFPPHTLAFLYYTGDSLEELKQKFFQRYKKVPGGTIEINLIFNEDNENPALGSFFFHFGKTRVYRKDQIGLRANIGIPADQAGDIREITHTYDRMTKAQLSENLRLKQKNRELKKLCGLLSGEVKTMLNQRIEDLIVFTFKKFNLDPAKVLSGLTEQEQADFISLLALFSVEPGAIHQTLQKVLDLPKIQAIRQKVEEGGQGHE